MATKTQKLKTFEPGHGYTKEDWDAVDFPELTDEELANMRPAKEVLPPEFFRTIEEHRRSRGRPSLEHPKKQVTLRLDEDVIAKFRASGKGWQGRMNEALRKAAGI
ncbi:BrnA antitoxin family protein [Shinella sp.]|uniref:BrnA antitoxin family protein n=1 Tax=Shinella sp. TaxID=1870904 RepID=UPI0029BE71C2|nr:BrnA antitoxin family protein [Shinella sp.]MDX3978019.1 BrnA antitoxin family protein [Shinella sp.]